MYHEEVCNRLRERMERAAEKDRSSHEKKLPATAKLAMLEDVMAVLRKYVPQLTIPGYRSKADE